MDDWAGKLYRELDEWNFAGGAASMWWRDDDAQAPSDALDRALELAQKYHAPLALAVIPHRMDDALAARLAAAKSTVCVLQHGFAHRNHARPDEQKLELGDHRPAAAVHHELGAGFAKLGSAFGARFTPALTPPWNRIAPGLLAGLADAGFTGLSTFGPRPAPAAAPGLRAVNTHADIIDWKNGKRFAGADAAAGALVAHLRARRLGEVDDAEPTGILTHHLVHDDAAWEFLAQLLAQLDDHPAVKWRRAAEIFGARN